MKIQNVIAITKQNTSIEFTDAQAINWIYTLDAMIFDRIIARHYNAICEEPKVYTSVNDDVILSTKNVDIYMRFIEMSVFNNTGDIQKFNNAATLFNAAYSNFENEYHNKHKPFERKIVY